MKLIILKWELIMKKFKGILIAILLLPAIFFMASCQEKITEIRVEDTVLEFQLFEDFSFDDVEIEKKVGKNWKTVALEEVEIVDSNYESTVAGTYTVKIKVKNFDQIITLTAEVKKQTPLFETISTVNAVYGQTLGDLSLPSGYTWKDSSLPVGDATDSNGREFEVIFVKGQSYNPVEGTVRVVVSRQDTSFVAVQPIHATYGQFLYQIALPSGYEWEQPDLSVGDYTSTGRDFNAIYKKGDNYNQATGLIKVLVAKATSVVNPICNVNNLRFGDTLPEITTSVGDTAGVVEWESGKTILTGLHTYTWHFTPTNSNFESASGEISINAGKKQLPIPQVSNAIYYTGSEQTVSFVNTSDLWQISGASTKTDVGTYQITIGLLDKSNYEWVGGTSIDLQKYWTIQKADLILETAPTLSDLEFGQTLADIQINGGVVKNSNNQVINGSFAFQNPTYAPTNSEDNTFILKFIQNNNNYNVLQFEVKIKIITVIGVDKTFDFDGLAHNIELQRTIDGDIITYSDTLNGEYVSTFGKTNAGVYEIFYKVQRDDKVFQGSAILTINALSLANANVLMNAETFAYIGKEIIPTIVYVKVGELTLTSNDYTLSCRNNINVGNGVLTLVGKNNATGTYEIIFPISKIDMDNAVVTLEKYSFQYTGAEIQPVIVSVVIDGVDISSENYTIEYINNVEVGEASVCLDGTNNTKGSIEVKFNIVAIDIANADVDLSQTQFDYTGNTITPSIAQVRVGNIILSANDYDFQYQNNTNAGTGIIILTGKNMASGTKRVEFTINPVSIATATVVLNAQEYVYTGNSIVPTVSSIKVGNIVLTANDYSINCSNNLNVGTATITFTGKNNAKGTVQHTFDITPISLSQAIVVLEDNGIVALNPMGSYPHIISVEVENVSISSSNYTVSYSSIFDEGIQTLTLTGTNNAFGSVVVNFTIKKLIADIMVEGETFYKFYSTQTPQYDFVVKVRYVNFNNYEKYDNYELKTFSGEELDMSVYDQSQSLYIWIEDVLYNEIISVEIIENQVEHIVYNIGTFKTVYKLGEELDNFELFSVVGYYTDLSTINFTYSPVQAKNTFNIITNYNKNQVGSYNLQIVPYFVDSSTYDFNINVVETFIFSGISKIQIQGEHFVGEELTEITASVFAYYNNDQSLYSFYEEITLDSSKINFDPEYDKESTATQYFIYTTSIEGQQYEFNGSLTLSTPWVESVYLVLGDKTYYPKQKYVLDLNIDVSAFKLFAKYSNSAVVEITQFESNFSGFNSVDENYENSVTITFSDNGHDQHYNFYFRNAMLPSNTDLSYVKINDENVIFENNVGNLVFSQNNIFIEIRCEKNSANIFVTIFEGNDTIYSNNQPGTFTHNLDSSWLKIFSKYEMRIVVVDGDSYQNYVVNLQRFVPISVIKVDGEEVNFENIYVFSGSTVEIVPIQENYIVEINNIEGASYTVKNDDSIFSIKIYDENYTLLFSHEFFNIKQTALFNEIYINNTPYEIPYNYYYFSIADMIAGEIVINGNNDVLQNNRFVYQIFDTNRDLILGKTELTSFPLTVNYQNLGGIAFFVLKNSYWDQILEVQFEEKTFIEKLVINYDNENSSHFDYYDNNSFNKIMLYANIVDSIEVVIASGYTGFYAKIVDSNMQEFDLRNLGKKNNLIIQIFDGANNLVQSVNCNLEYCPTIVFDYTEQMTHTEYILGQKQIEHIFLTAKLDDVIQVLNENNQLKIYKNDVLVANNILDIVYGCEKYTFEIYINSETSDLLLSYDLLISISAEKVNDVISNIETHNDNINFYIDELLFTCSSYAEFEEAIKSFEVCLLNSTYRWEYIYDSEKHLLAFNIFNETNDLISSFYFVVQLNSFLTDDTRISYIGHITISDLHILNFENYSLSIATATPLDEINIDLYDYNANIFVFYNGELLRTNKGSLYFNFVGDGDYTIKVVSSNNLVSQDYTITVEYFDTTPILQVTIGQNVYKLDNTQDGPQGDFKYVIQGETIKFEKYFGEMPEISSLIVSLKSCFGDNVFKDYELNSITNLDNVSLPVLVNDKQQRYCLFYIAINNGQENVDVGVYLYFCDEPADIVFNIGQTELSCNFNIVAMTFGDFSLDQDNGYVYASVSREQIGIDANAETVDILITVYHASMNIVAYDSVVISASQPMETTQTQIINDEMGCYVMVFFNYPELDLENLPCVIFITD